MWIAKGDGAIAAGTGCVTLLRGKRTGLEIVLSGKPLEDALEELRARLEERPGFYRGTSSVVIFGTEPAASQHLIKLQSLLTGSGIALRAVSGGEAAQAAASELGVPYEAGEPTGELQHRRILRPRQSVQLSEAARSLVADFAGARADIAERRRRGEASVPRAAEPAEPPAAPVAQERPAAPLRVVETPPGTLYHTGTLRGGQALHHVGNVVVVGDVNPGAEIVATGDVLVFGRLAGVAHAGAQGDATARVYALELVPTQLRIATFIAADDEAATKNKPEAAIVEGGRITVVPLDRASTLPLRGASA